jgi:hypothetical protein
MSGTLAIRELIFQNNQVDASRVSGYTWVELAVSGGKPIYISPHDKSVLVNGTVTGIRAWRANCFSPPEYFKWNDLKVKIPADVEVTIEGERDLTPLDRTDYLIYLGTKGPLSARTQLALLCSSNGSRFLRMAVMVLTPRPPMRSVSRTKTSTLLA